MSRSNNYRKDKAEAAQLFRAFGVNSSEEQQPTTSRNHTNIEQENSEDSYQSASESSEQDDTIVAVVEEDEDREVDSSESDDDIPLPNFVDIRVKLAQWSTNNHVSDDAMDDLLHYLKVHHFPHLPKTYRTLKADAKLKNAPIKKMGDGEFCYMGIKRAVEQILVMNDVNLTPNIQYSLQFGIDGLTLTKSSKSCFWPILVKIIGFREVLPVAVFCGTSKPSSVHEYMDEFITELDQVLKNGMEINKLRLMFSVDSFIMDAPAKAFVLDIKVVQLKFVIIH